MGADLKLPRFFFYIMKYVTPVYLFILLAFWFFQDGLNVLFMHGVPKENHPYIWFARFLMTGILLAVIFLVGIGCQEKHRIQQRVP